MEECPCKKQKTCDVNDNICNCHKINVEPEKEKEETQEVNAYEVEVENNENKPSLPYSLLKSLTILTTVLGTQLLLLSDQLIKEEVDQSLKDIKTFITDYEAQQQDE